MVDTKLPALLGDCAILYLVYFNNGVEFQNIWRFFLAIKVEYTDPNSDARCEKMREIALFTAVAVLCPDSFDDTPE